MRRDPSAPSSSSVPPPPRRHSPRWREPLVDEYPARPPPPPADDEWHRWSGRNGRMHPEELEPEAEAEERPFFSEEFYRAFPELRGTDGGGGGKFRNGRRFSSQLDRFDSNWRDDPFWRDLYPRWAEPIFKSGMDVKTNIINDGRRFAVEVDTYQFRPEELQVKTMDDTLLIEGRHEDVRDRDNYTRMQFIRKYQLPADVEPHTISSHIDSAGRLTVEAQKRWQPLDSGERAIPIESGSAARRFGGSASRASDRYYAGGADSGRGSSAADYFGGRADSRADGGGSFLGSPKPRSDGYRTEYEQRQTDANGMRHEAHREEFREEFRRSGSAANALVPPAPALLPRPASPFRSEFGAGAASSSESRQHFRRTASASSREFRSSNGYGGENLLRPAEELGGRSSAFGTRNVPIHRG